MSSVDGLHLAKLMVLFLTQLPKCTSFVLLDEHDGLPLASSGGLQFQRHASGLYIDNSEMLRWSASHSAFIKLRQSGWVTPNNQKPSVGTSL